MYELCYRSAGYIYNDDDGGVGDDVDDYDELTAHCNNTFNYHRLQNYSPCFMLHDMT
jgi:hypothetical protein